MLSQLLDICSGASIRVFTLFLGGEARQLVNKEAVQSADVEGSVCIIDYSKLSPTRVLQIEMFCRKDARDYEMV